MDDVADRAAGRWPELDAEIASVDCPGERLILCHNPSVAAERSRKREELLAATERGLSEIAERVARGTLSGAAQIGLAVGALANHWKVKKHLDIQITDTTLSFARKHSQIEAEAIQLVEHAPVAT